MICLHVCEDPRRMSNCTHHYCGSCMEDWLRESDNQRCPQCLTPGGSVPPSPDFQQKIRSLPAKCYNQSSGCRERVPFGQLGEHALECMFRLIGCPRSCNVILPVVAMPTHLLTCGLVDPLMQWLMCYECRELYTNGHRPNHCNYYSLARNIRMQQVLAVINERNAVESHGNNNDGRGEQ